MYTYAFLPNAIGLQNLPPGIAGSLQLIGTDQVVALVEPDLELAWIEQNDERLMQAVFSHDRVLREVFSQTTILPLRFGTCFISKAALLEHLHAHASTYQATLTRLRGKAEYTLKLTPIELPEEDSLSEATGRNYFLAKKQRYQVQMEYQQQQQEELQQIKAWVADGYPNLVYGNPHDGVERLYLLGDRQTESALLDHLIHWRSQSSRWELSLGEALPPYHFV